MKRIIDETKIIKFMKDNNLQAKEFCKMCRVPEKALAKILINDLNYDFRYIIRIANVMNIDFRELIIG